MLPLWETVLPGYYDSLGVRWCNESLPQLEMSLNHDHGITRLSSCCCKFVKGLALEPNQISFLKQTLGHCHVFILTYAKRCTFTLMVSVQPRLGTNLVHALMSAG